MANRRYGYQYETSPRKIEPDYKKPNVKKKKTVQKKSTQSNKKQNKSVKNKQKKKFKLSFEVKFFINSMLFFGLIFAVIAGQALVNQRYKEKENLKQQYAELQSAINMQSNGNEDIRRVASGYGMQTKSATLVALETSDYIESSKNEVEIEDDGFWSSLVNWFKTKF